MITLEALFVQTVDDHGEAGGGEQGDEDSVDCSGLRDSVLVRETPVEEEEPVNAAQSQSTVLLNLFTTEKMLPKVRQWIPSPI